MDQEAWQLSGLFKRALARSKDRLIPYLLSIVIGVLLVFISLIFSSLVLIILVWLSGRVNQPIIANYSLMFAGVFLGIFGLLWIYFGSWLALAANLVVMGESKLTVRQAFATTLPKVNGFIWLSLLNSLFFIGLLPWGFLSFFLVIAVWAIWGSFTTFVYLDEARLGLGSLFASRQMMQGKFFRILCYQLIFLGTATVVSLIFSYVGNKSLVFSLLQILFALFIGYFTYCFNYELYRNLPVPQTVQKPKVWIALSLVGWILVLVTSVFLAQIIVKEIRFLRSNPQNKLAAGPAPLALKKKLQQEELPFQEAIKKLGITPILEKDDQDDLCGPDQCHRDIEILYAGDKPIREKVGEIAQKFESQGWSGQVVTESRTLDDFIQWFEKAGGKLFIVGFSKNDFHANLIVADSRIKEDDCFMTKICIHARNKKYPYILAIRYSINVSNETPKKTGFTDELAFKLFLTPAITPTPIPTPVVISTLTEDAGRQEYIYTNKTYEYRLRFPLSWKHAPGFDNTGIRFTDSQINISDSPLASGKKDTTPQSIAASTSVSLLNSHWYMTEDKKYTINTIEDLYNSIHIGGGLPSYHTKKYITLLGFRGIETTGSDEAGDYFINTEFVYNNLLYSVGAFNYYPVENWEKKYRQILDSFEFL